MTWLQPWAAWFLAGIPAIVLLYFLRLKRRPVSVSTLMFWQRAIQESGRSAFFQKLRHLLSLLLHLVIFLLLLAALARPVPRDSMQSGTSTVLILDSRARMQAIEPGGATRFATALRLARDYARQAGSQREFALLTLADKPAVAVPFTGDEKPLLQVLDQLSPSDAAGDLQAAVSLARSLLAARSGERRIVVLTDRATMPSGTEILTHAVGSSLDNVAITRFATRPLPGNPQTSEVLLETQNFSNSPVRTEVELAFDGRPLEVKPIHLAANERRLDVFTSVPRPARSARGWLTAKLTMKDALPPDNVAFATLPPPRMNRVLLVSKGNAFLEKLLAVDPAVKFQFVTPEAYEPSMAAKFEAVIFDGTIPAQFDLNLAGGNFLFLKATPFTGTGAELEQPLITDVDRSHPATRLASLQNIVIQKAQSLVTPEPHDGWTFRVPLRSEGHPLLVTGERAGQRVAALAFDLLESDLPLRVAFPLLITGTLQWLSGEPADPLPPLSAGDVLPLPRKSAVAPVPLTAPPRPQDKTQAMSVTGFFQPLKNGFYALDDDGTTRWLAVNTFSPAESDLRVPLAAETTAAAIPTPAATLRGWPFWQWLALGAFLLIVAEWWLFHQRKTE